jgi:CHAT domain-containing protein
VEAHALYGLFFDGLGTEFDNLSALTVASDGALESLPLAVLVTRVAEDPADQTWSYQNSSWLSDRAVITITPSFAAALALRERPDVAAAPDPFIGFGDPALAPHWPVDARATRSFMQVLGEHKGENAAKAFSAAARALRNQARFAHPAFWAPFDLVGRGRELAAVNIPESPSPSRSR